ncbi:type-4 uracil-DNA glycosylase [Staphylothermus hellenicus]|uniref:Type-4 uracil-DNA glycosylase n=1 Tax=Staphylothermus hellenicus (strain DSM 12710 / JCM 10830 / BK20S6-10-b1 / P8) TaxID=591019 RepID=D7D8Y8_STAHD|nr:type-4 uracil-DNA glycosylase [Staphylothermus hellenicus]ADI32234.1 phage SPO1 DNA polymerase-related protein [Staphylothermus hellenicus DSM 12710]
MGSNNCNELARLAEEIKKCRKCTLYLSRKNAVPGEGPCNADVMFVGEAPGSKEDETGRPFVGAAGKLLMQLLELIGLKRSDVYITNVVKCRPPNNRDPTPEEIEACSPYLIRQIKIIKPKIIVALGRHSARFLFSRAGLKWSNMRRMHGKVFSARIDGVEVKIMATYHPAAALYSPKLRPDLENDFRVLESLIHGIHGKSTTKYRTILDFLK